MKLKNPKGKIYRHNRKRILDCSFCLLGAIGEYDVIFPEIHSVFDLNEADIEDFSEGLLRLFKYFDSKSIYSFNMTIFCTGWPSRTVFPCMRVLFREHI